MDTKPILATIEADAREAVAHILKEAEDRVLSIHELADMNLARQKSQTLQEAEAESLKTVQRLERLAELENRKELLRQQRLLMDKAFDLALQKLRQLPAEALSNWLLGQLLSAQGDEQVQAGEHNDSFFTPDFLKKANAQLVESGKTGSLSDKGGRMPGVTGLVLFGRGAEVYLSLESALELRRLDLETRLAQMLFGE
ncbi:MAG: V-type ATP synthase subunit E [Eubacteriales bacterium]|nr:V-type ATP synthase subunit E [Eubacteriales bacterium]